MLTDGFDHVAVLTADTERFVAFYTEVFGAEVTGRMDDGPLHLTIVRVGPHAELNVFEIDGNEQASRNSPMFERGRLDHLGLRASSLETFEQIRADLVARGASDGFVTDFGPVLSVFFRDPDGLEGEVCVENPDAVPGALNPPGTPSARFPMP